MCPSFTYNKMATGTWTLQFSEPTALGFAPLVFVVASPTYLTDYVYGTITSSMTLPPVASSTTTTTQTTGTTTLTNTLLPEPSSTTTATAYSTTVFATDYSTPPPSSTQVVTEYTNTILSTITLSAEPSSTTTVTEYSGTSVATDLSTSTLDNIAKLTEYLCSSSSSSSSASSTPAATTPTPLSCPGDDGTPYTAADGAIYTIECATDHYGGNLAMSYQDSLEKCIELCESSAGCVDVSFLPGNPSGPCYLKQSVGEKQTNSGVWGALKVSGASATPSSSSLSSSSVSATSSPTGVSSACPNGVLSSAPSCPSSDGTCYAVNGDLYSVSCFTGSYGGDLALSWESTFQACLTTCSTTPGCIDVSYPASSDGGNAPCYMKSAIGEARSDSRIWGGRLISSAASSTTSTSDTAASSSSASSTTLTTMVSVVVPLKARVTGPPAFTKGPNYTFPPIPHTTVTTGPVSTQTITPSPSGIATATSYVLATTTSTQTPAPSGVKTSTLTTASTSYTTVTYPPSVATSTLQTDSTSFTTATPAKSGLASTTVTLEDYQTSVAVTWVTGSAQVSTVTITGCPSSTRSVTPPEASTV
ncbi:hypothetical protein BU16DRAFT_108581 [Lophium mytilinum]|uniref:Apple domain-containing protein n=1 Tax=Lophium mytilinum TaxID=390894 RepID=A0A6A6QJS3_9PEZI|nr:hypothetical protein BU16DRAFT_108581 [Lophium mytilinum]